MYRTASVFAATCVLGLGILASLAGDCAQAQTAKKARGKASAAAAPRVGPLVKIRTSAEGIYGVPKDTIARGAGLDQGGAGIPAALTKGRDAEVLFYAPAPEGFYDNGVTTWAGKPSRKGYRAVRVPAPRSLSAKKAADLVQAYATVTYGPDESYWTTNPAVEGADPVFWFTSLKLTEGKSFDVPALAAPGYAGGEAVLKVGLGHYSESAAFEPDHRIEVSVNGIAVGTIETDGRLYAVYPLTIPGGVLAEAGNAVRLTVPKRDGLDYDRQNLDFVSIQYPTSAAAASGAFEAKDAGYLHLAGAGEDAVIFDTVRGSWCQPFKAKNQAGLFVAAEAGGRYLIASREDVRSPDTIERVTLTAVALTEDKRKVNYLAIGAEAYRDAVAPLLAAVGQEGHVARYLSLESAVDQFGDGQFGPLGVRRAIQYIRPEFVLLVGRNHFDYLNRLGFGARDLCPSYWPVTEYVGRVASDLPFADFNDDLAPDLALGRLPAQNVQEMQAAVAAILAARGNLAEQVVLVSGVQDSAKGYDFRKDMDGIAALNLFPNTTVRADADTIGAPQTTQALAANLAAKRSITGYLGHGALKAWNNGILTDTAAAQWLPGQWVFSATCLTGSYYWPQTGFRCLADAATVVAPRAAGFIASTGMCTEDPQKDALAELLRAVAEAPSGIPQGEVWKKAMTAMAMKRQADASVATRPIESVLRTYTLFGDPALILQHGSVTPPAADHSGQRAQQGDF